jgi:hypothetical protein
VAASREQSERTDQLSETFTLTGLNELVGDEGRVAVNHSGHGVVPLLLTAVWLPPAVSPFIDGLANR